MANLAKVVTLVAVAVLCAGSVPAAAADAPTSGVEAGDTSAWLTVSAEDAAYLRGLAGDTWACIAHYVEPQTGLPYDTSERGEYSSATNLGYYAACCAIAAEMKLVSHQEAAQRVRRVLEAHGRFRKWKGFSQSWNHVRTLEPAPHDQMISLLDSGNMAAGFIVAGMVLPELRVQVDETLAELDWGAFYDPTRGLLYGGYHMGDGRIDRGWHIGDYAGDGRMAAFLAIASGGAPADSWDKLGRKTEEHFGLTIYQPAWMGGGLFMQMQDCLFLDERSTPAGRSAADFAYAQMLYASTLDQEVWGWSACFSPDGRYLGWGGLEVAVVTPHAAGMMAMLYPHKTVECLRKLESMGVRAPLSENSQVRRFGFRDSIDLTSRRVSDLYLPNLDQAMLFLSIANALEERVVHRAFARHPLVRRGCRMIGEYSQPQDRGWLAELRRRDREPLPASRSPSVEGPAHVVIDDFEGTDIKRNRLGGPLHTWTRDAADAEASIRVARDRIERKGVSSACLRIDYDVDSPKPTFGGVNLLLGGANGGGCNALELWARGTPAEVKLELHGSGGIGVTRLRGIKPDAWTRVVIPFAKLGGMITDWSSLEKLVLVLEDRTVEQKVGALWIDDVALIRSP
ncbi:MAG: hypothetical protein GY842_08985 [bacterium]|nr:hypothetical protein [bacterium]